jgi:hypothetical protein
MINFFYQNLNFSDLISLQILLNSSIQNILPTTAFHKKTKNFQSFSIKSCLILILLILFEVNLNKI